MEIEFISIKKFMIVLPQKKKNYDRETRLKTVVLKRVNEIIESGSKASIVI